MQIAPQDNFTAAKKVYEVLGAAGLEGLCLRTPCN